MPTGRTVPQRFDRVYIDGLDMSAYTRGDVPVALGPLSWMFDEVDFFALSDAVQGAFPGMPHISPGTLNGIFDNTATTGLHALASGAGVKRLVTLARGIQAAPALGDPCFTAYCVQDNYMGVQAGQAQMVTIKFGQVEDTTIIAFPKPWGPLLHAKQAETAVNSSGTGADDLISPATTSANGGYFWYHLLTSDGNVTLKAQNSATQVNGNYVDITGATSGVITGAVSPQFGIVATAAGLSVLRYLRWQLVFSGGTTATFVCGFVRG
jgi:hypothetical protein